MTVKLSHINNSGQVKMVDIGHKKQQLRIAGAKGRIKLSEKTIELIKKNNLKKGDVLSVSRIAGIQAAKMTPQLIPLCHPLNITQIDVQAKILKKSIEVNSMVKCIGQTGVEMEALTAVHVALLTIYDMCKAVDKNMVVEDIHLVNKDKEDLE
jgi:cyclic pyranopterin phosphate synthase